MSQSVGFTLSEFVTPMLSNMVATSHMKNTFTIMINFHETFILPKSPSNSRVGLKATFFLAIECMVIKSVTITSVVLFSVTDSDFIYKTGYK